MLNNRAPPRAPQRGPRTGAKGAKIKSKSCLRRLLGGRGRLPGQVGRCDGKRPKNGLYRHSDQTGLGGDQSFESLADKDVRGPAAAPRAPLGTLLGRPWGSLSRSWAGPAPSRSPKSSSRHAQNVQKARHRSQAEPVLPKICVQCESKNVQKTICFAVFFKNVGKLCFVTP